MKKRSLKRALVNNLILWGTIAIVIAGIVYIPKLYTNYQKSIEIYGNTISQSNVESNQRTIEFQASVYQYGVGEVTK